MATTDLESDQDVGLSVVDNPLTQRQSDQEVGLAPAPETQAAQFMQAAAPPRDEELNRQLLENAQNVTPLGMAAQGLEAMRRVAKSRLGIARPEEGTTLPEIQRSIIARPPSFAEEIFKPVVDYQPYKIQPDDHVLTAIGKEAANVAVSIPEFFTSVGGAIAGPAAAEFPVTTGLSFTTDMLYNLGKGIRDTIKNWTGLTPAQKAAGIVDLGANGLMALAAGAGTTRSYANQLTIPDIEARRTASEEAYREALAPRRRLTLQPERTDYATRIGQLGSSEETQLQGVREGENLRAYPAEVRQEESQRATGGGGVEPSPQVQAATPPNELLATYPYGSTIHFRWPEGGLAQGTVVGITGAGRIRLNVAGQEFPVFISERDITEAPAGPAPESPPAAPPPVPPATAPATPPAAAPLPPITPELMTRARDVRARAIQLVQERSISTADRNALYNISDRAAQGDIAPLEDWVSRMEQAPMKPPKEIRRVTSLSRFYQETDVPDILSWIADNMKLLSKSAAKKLWGTERYEQNADLWDDAPDDLPMHHSTAIYGGRAGPDRVAQAAFEAGVLKTGPYPADLWRAVRQASRVRRGLESGEAREATTLAQEEQAQIQWEEATRQQEGRTPVTTEEVGPGYVVEVGGERLSASAPTEDGDVNLTGSRKFGDRILREGQTIYVDAIRPPEGQAEATFEPEAAAPPAAPAVEAPAAAEAAAAPVAPETPTAPEAPKPAKFGGAAPVGSRVENYIKAENGRWYLTDEEGNRRNVPPVNDRKHKQLEAQAAAPPAPAETRTPAQILSAAKRVRVKGPAGATFIRVTDANGRSSQLSIRDVNDGENVFQGVDIARLEAGSINRQGNFQPIEGAITVEEIGRTAQALGEPDSEQGIKNALSITVDKEFSNPQFRNEALARGESVREEQPNLSRLTQSKSLFHETGLDNAYEVFRGLLRPFKQSWVRFFGSDNPDLALGQHGQTGVLFELDPERVNGWRHPKPGTSEQTGFEYNIDRTIRRAVKSVTFKTQRQLDAFRKRFPNYFDYDNAEQTERGLKVTPKRQTAQALEEQETPVGMTRQQVADYVQSTLGSTDKVRVINRPGQGLPGEAWYDPARGNLPEDFGIVLNSSAIRDQAHLQWLLDHEMAHIADFRGNLRDALQAVTPAEVGEIAKEIQRLKYRPDQFGDEQSARGLQVLAESWRNRSWFQKLLGNVLAIANHLGFKMTRLAAEKLAAEAIADALAPVRKGSVLNPFAVLRIGQSLPLNAKDWEMKQFFDTIGLQAATIGGYLHRYTRQVFHADRLEVSDRSRALDGMNQARELTELAQGVGGRANYYDAIRDATTQGERNEVLRSAFESAIRYQESGVKLRSKLADKLSEIQSESFRNKLLRAARTRERAELAEEVRRTYTLQVGASAGRIMQTLNSLRTVGAAHEQLQADLARLQQMPQFDRAVQQHFDDIVNRLSQSDRGISLLLGGGDRTGQDIWDEYLRQRFANNLGIPQGNEFTLGQLASNVLAANRDLRNQFGSLALLARDIITTQEWNRAASRIAQTLQSDPVKGIPRILERAANLGEREARAESAFLTLNRGIQKTLRDYNDYEQAVQLHTAVEADPQYRQWVNDVMQHPEVQGLPIPEEVRARMEGKPQPFFKYTGQDTVYSPDGKPYHINLQFTPENVQATMADLINLNADITDWLDPSTHPENRDNPSRLYWQERQRLLQGVLQSAAIWNPGAIESLVTRSSYGIPENLFQGLALPAAKLAYNAFKAFDRYFTQGKGWFGNNHDVSERTIQKAYKKHGFNELDRKAYQRSFLNALGWEFRNGRDVRPGQIINGVTITAEDLALLHSEGRMINDLYDRLGKAGREAGAGGVTELPRIIDEFTGGAWGIRRPMEIGIHANTTLPHSFSQHGEDLSIQIHSLITARNNELTKLPERVVAEGMDEATQNAARADIQRRYHESLALTLNDSDVFQNAVLGFMRQRSENWVRLDGLSPFEQHYRAITELVSNGDPTAPRTVEEVIDWIHQRLPPEEEWSLDRVRAQFAGEWEKLAERFYRMHADSDAGIRISSDKRQTAFTQAFRQDLGPAYFYDYGWIDAGEMRRYSSDMAEFGFERLMESLRALDRNMTEAMAELGAAAEERKPEIVKRTAEAYRTGQDFRDLQHLQSKQIELRRLINAMPKYVGANAVHAEGLSLKSINRFVSLAIGAALTGPRTAFRIMGISGGGSAWKMGIVFQQLGYGRIRSYPAAAASAMISAFRVGTATLLGWYHPGERGFVPGVPLRVLMNVPGAVRSAVAAKGSERLYSAIETVLNGTTDEQFAALGWWFDQKALGMTPDVAMGSRVAAILSASRTKGGVLSRPEQIPTGTASRALAAVKLAASKPLAALEAFVAGTNVYLPGAFGYNITYDAVGRQAGWYIDMLAANARRTFDTYERLGQLDRFNFDNLTDPRNKLQPWEVLPSFAGRFRFVDPAKLPGWARPNSTNLQFARELFATSTDVDLQDLLLRYWKRLASTPRDQRGAVEFLAPEELDAGRAQTSAEARARGIISRFVEQTHHAAPSNRPHQLQQAWPIQSILPFMGWSAQTLKLIDATLGRAAFSTERNGMTADTYSALLIAAGMTALGVGAFAFVGGDLESRLVRQLDRLLHHKEGTVKTIDEAADAKEAAEITLHNMTASIPMLNSTLNQLFGITGYRGGNVGFQAFAFDKVNSMLTYARDVYRTHDLTHGLDRLAEANIPISETIIENTFQREGLQNNRNAVRVLQKLGPQDLVERRASLSIALPTEMTPYRQALLEAIGSGDQKQVAETYSAFIQKATELGRTDPEKLARQMFSTLNPYRQAFGGVLTDQQRADTLSKASDVQRKYVETMEQNYAAAANTLGLTADFEKQEKAPPIQRAAGGGGGGGVSFPSGRAAAGAGGGAIGRIGVGLRRPSLTGPKPPRIRLPGLAGLGGGGAGKSRTAARPRLVHGRLRARSTKLRRVSTGRRSRRRLSLSA